MSCALASQWVEIPSALPVVWWAEWRSWPMQRRVLNCWGSKSMQPLTVAIVEVGGFRKFLHPIYGVLNQKLGVVGNPPNHAILMGFGTMIFTIHFGGIYTPYFWFNTHIIQEKKFIVQFVPQNGKTQLIQIWLLAWGFNKNSLGKRYGFRVFHQHCCFTDPQVQPLMPLGNVWAWPFKVYLPSRRRILAMSFRRCQIFIKIFIGGFMFVLHFFFFFSGGYFFRWRNVSWI